MEDNERLQADGEERFHRSRQMFLHTGGRVHVEPAAVPYGHDKVYEWMSESQKGIDGPIAKQYLPRGYIDLETGDVYFYVGAVFDVVDRETVKSMLREIFQHAEPCQALKDLMLSCGTVYSGVVRGLPGTRWLPIMRFGSVAGLLA